MILDSYLDIADVCVQLLDVQDEKLFLINHEKMDAYNNLISKKQVPWPMTKRLNSLLAWSVWGRCFPLKLYNLVCVLPDSISCYQKLLAFWYCIVFLKVCLISLVMFPCLVHAAFPATVKTGVQESRRLKALSRRLKLSHWHEDQSHLLPTYLCSLRFYFILSSKLKSYVWSL
jgi:hypothetical protein